MKARRIHLVERGDRFAMLGDREYESGFWDVPPRIAKRLIGGLICFHKSQRQPSFFGGTILGYRVQDSGEFQGRIVFRLESSREFKGLVAGPGWHRDSKIVCKAS